MPEFLDLHGKTTKVLRAAADAGMRRHGQGLRLWTDHVDQRGTRVQQPSGLLSAGDE